ncbi:MAG: hypothetical protein RL355_43 [Actinomycetota bacterium]
MDFRLGSFATGLWFGTCVTIMVASKFAPADILLWLLIAFAFAILNYQKSKIFIWDKTSIRLAAVGLIAGAGLAGLRLAPLYSEPLTGAANERAVVEVTGLTIDDVRRSQVVNALDLGTRDFGVFKFQATQVKFRGDTFQLRVPVQVFVSGEQFTKVKNLPPKTKLTLIGKLNPSEKIRGVVAKLTVTGDVLIIQTPPKYQFLASYFRNSLHRTLANFPDKPAGLVPGLALGDVSRLDPVLAKQMKSSGLTHLTAVSGSNVTLLIALILGFGRKLRLSNKTNYYIALLGLTGFVVLVRPQPSVLRASVMGVIMVLALLSKSPKSAIPALIGSVIALIFIDPWLSISYGFALSVFATAGLLLWANSLIQIFDRVIPRKVPHWLVLGLVVTVSAQIAVFPILVSLGSPISLGSLPANLISVPLAGPTMIFGLLAALVANIFNPLAQLIGLIAIGCAQGIVICAQFFSRQSWLVIPWPKGLGGVVLAILAIVLGVRSKLLWPRFSSGQKQIVVTCWLTCVLMLWQRPLTVLTGWVPPNWQIASCDVGQGDATVIRVSSSEAIVIDVGGNPELVNKCLSDLKVKKISLLLLTHFHADHVVGLPGAIAGREVGQIRISPLSDPPLTTKFVMQVLAENQMQSSVLAYPDYLKVGSIELFCIWPKRKTDFDSNTPNNASVSVLIRTSNLTVLLPGDIEPIAQEAILKLIPDPSAIVVKVPHHGSRYQSTNFARATKAKLAIISVGKDNDYGHPSNDTIYLYESIGAKVVRTDEHGSIAIWQSGDKVNIKSEK